MKIPTLDLRKQQQAVRKQAPQVAEQDQEDTREISSDPPPPEDPQPRLARGTVLVSWTAPEHVVYKKTTAWYIGLGVAIALLIFAAVVLLQSILAVIIFSMLGTMIFIYSEQKPKIVEYDIRTSGIRIGNRVYLYRELLTFNIVEQGYGVYLIIKSRRKFMPLIHVPLGDADPEAVYSTLVNFLDDDPDLVEPLADIIAHWLGF